MKTDADKNWWRFYFTRMSLVLIVIAAILYFQNNTSNITVSNHYEKLDCATSIHLQQAESIEDYTQNVAPNKGLAAQICTFNQIFNGKDIDRIHLLKFSEERLDDLFLGRPDIAQYFYRKIIAANPDDTLSLYIKTYKLNAKE